MKQLLKNISPFNNRTEMPIALFILKKVLAFFLCYILGALIGEGAIILLHFAFGKNMLIGDVFDEQTMMLLTYYGYIIIMGVSLLYWKIVLKKPLSEMGVTKYFGNYFIGAITGVIILTVIVVAIILTGNIKYHGIFENADILMIVFFIGGFVIQGATEEFLCRGIVFHSLKENTSLVVAMNTSTLMFIIPHLSSLFDGEALYCIVGIINLYLISSIFSLLTILFRSIWVACGFHSFWNAVLYSILGLNLSGSDGTVTSIFNLQSKGENIYNGGVYGIEASIVTTAVLFITIIILIWLTSKNRATIKQSSRIEK